MTTIGIFTRKALSLSVKALILCVNLKAVLAVAFAGIFGQSCPVKLDQIDTDGVPSPEEKDYEDQLRNVKEHNSVTKAVTVTLQLNRRKPFKLTKGGAASYWALRGKGIQYGPVDLG